MGWITILGDDTLKFYSLADSVENLYEMFFEFWTYFSPGAIVLFMMTFCVLIIVGLVWSIYRAVKNEGVIAT